MTKCPCGRAERRAPGRPCKICGREEKARRAVSRPSRVEYRPADEFEITVVPPPVEPRERLELRRMRDENAVLRTRLRETEELAASGEGLRELIGSLGAPNVQANPEWLKGASRMRGTHGTANLFLSDIHADEVVHPRQIGGCNEYNREICHDRIRHTFKTAIMLLKGYMAVPKYDGAVLALGGDIISGSIHEELAETNEAPPLVTLQALEPVLIEAVGGFADEFGKVHVPCVTGNHGRIHKKPRAKNRAFENFEWTLYQRLAAYFKSDSRITFDIPDGPDAQWAMYDKRYRLTHGDQFQGGGGIGGILVPIMRGAAKKLTSAQAIGDPFDVIMMGHWHQYIHTNSVIVNGSVKGYDEYAFQGNFPFEPPQQACFVTHPEVGQTFRMPIKCAHKGAGSLSRKAS